MKKAKKMFILLAGLLIAAHLMGAKLQDVYKNGPITLNGSKEFGKDIDWENLFSDGYREIAAAPDGSIFVSNNRQHNLYKFDKNGRFLKKFGQKGEGPGDFYHPGDLSILNGKYLVVSNYPLNRKFSIVDFEGNCIKIVKTKFNIFRLTALRENIVAYATLSQYANKKNGFKREFRVILKNIKTGTEKTLRTISLLNRGAMKYNDHATISIGDFFGNMLMAKTVEGNLAICISNQPEVTVYSPRGKKISSFKLKFKPIPVTGEYVNSFRKKNLERLEAMDTSTMPGSRKNWHKIEKKLFRTYDLSRIFDTHFPLYRDVYVDSQGNFLFFEFSDCQDNCKYRFQVYSKTGEFVCQSEINPGKYLFHVDYRFKKISFIDDGIIGIFMNRDDEDEVVRLTKTKFSVSSTVAGK